LRSSESNSSEDHLQGSKLPALGCTLTDTTTRCLSVSVCPRKCAVGRSAVCCQVTAGFKGR